MIPNLRKRLASLGRDAVLRRLSRNSAWLFGGQGYSALTGFVLNVLLARALGARDFGVVILIATLATTATQIVDSRAWEAAVKYVSDFLGKGDTSSAVAMLKLCYAVDAVTAVLGFIALAVLAPWAARVVLDDAAIASLVRVYAVTVIVSFPIGTSSAILRIANRFDWLTFHAAAVATLRLGAGIVAWAWLPRVDVVIGAYVVAAAVGSVIITAYAVRASLHLELTGWRASSIGILRPSARGIGKFLLSTNLAALLKLAQRNLDLLLIGAIVGPAAASYYRVGRTISDVLGFPLGPVYAATYPELASLWSKKLFGQFRQLSRQLLVVATTAAFVLGTVFFSLTSVIIKIFYGEEYVTSIAVTRWLIVGTAIAVSVSFLHPILLASGRAAQSARATGIAVAGQLVVLLALARPLGVDAAGIAYVVFCLLWSVFAGIPAMRALELRETFT